MAHDSDFELLARGYSIVTVNVVYFIPDHSSLVNEFMWQTIDLQPEYPRVVKFLDYWKREIDAVIKDVLVADSHGFNPTRFRKLDGLFTLN